MPFRFVPCSTDGQDVSAPSSFTWASEATLDAANLAPGLNATDSRRRIPTLHFTEAADGCVTARLAQQGDQAFIRRHGSERLRPVLPRGIHDVEHGDVVILCQEGGYFRLEKMGRATVGSATIRRGSSLSFRQQSFPAPTESSASSYATQIAPASMPADSATLLQRSDSGDTVILIDHVPVAPAVVVRKLSGTSAPGAPLRRASSAAGPSSSSSESASSLHSIHSVASKDSVAMRSAIGIITVTDVARQLFGTTIACYRTGPHYSTAAVSLWTQALARLGGVLTMDPPLPAAFGSTTARGASSTSAATNRVIVIVDDDVTVEQLKQRWWNRAHAYSPANASAAAANRTLLPCASNGVPNLSPTGHPSPFTAEYHTPQWLFKTVNACQAAVAKLKDKRRHSDGDVRAASTTQSSSTSAASSAANGGATAAATAEARPPVLAPASFAVWRGWSEAAPAAQQTQHSSALRSGKSAAAARNDHNSNDDGDDGEGEPKEDAVPSTGGDMSPEDIARLYAMGDAVSRWGVVPGRRPLQCPWTRAQLMGPPKMRTLLKACPWLEVVVPPAPGDPPEDQYDTEGHTSGPGSGSKRSRGSPSRYGSTSTGSGSASGKRRSVILIDGADSDAEEEEERLKQEEAEKRAAAAAAEADAGADSDGGLSSDEDGVTSPRSQATKRSRITTGKSIAMSRAPSRKGTVITTGTRVTTASALIRAFTVGAHLNDHITAPLKLLLAAKRAGPTQLEPHKRHQLDCAIGWLESLPFKVTNVNQTEGIPHIGKETRAKILEILTTGKLQRNDTLLADPKTRAKLQFLRVHGVGPKKADDLWRAGARTLDDLRAGGPFEFMLTDAGRVCLKYIDELDVPISREEAHEVGELVRSELRLMFPSPGAASSGKALKRSRSRPNRTPSGRVIDLAAEEDADAAGEPVYFPDDVGAGDVFKMAVGGSYRRGAPFSSDLDIIISPPVDCKAHAGDVLLQLAARLRKRGLITDDVMLPHGSGHGQGQGAIEVHSGVSSSEPSTGSSGTSVPSIPLPHENTGSHIVPPSTGSTGHTFSPGDRTIKSPAAHKPAEDKAAASASAPRAPLPDPNNPPPLASAMVPLTGRGAATGAGVGAGAGPTPSLQLDADAEADVHHAKYFGIYCLPHRATFGNDRSRHGPPPHRRIDLVCFARHMLPYALIQWTGNTIVNRSLRLYANYLGFDLSDIGLVWAPAATHATEAHYQRGRKGPPPPAQARHGLPIAASEFDVFSQLGLRFIPPNRRACFGNPPVDRAGADEADGKD